VSKKFLVDVIVTYQLCAESDEDFKEAIQTLKSDIKENLLFDTLGGAYSLVKKKCRIADTGFTPLTRKKRATK